MSYEKLIARHVHASSVGWTLIDNGKLTNHIARLEGTVVKYSVPTTYMDGTYVSSLTFCASLKLQFLIGVEK